MERYGCDRPDLRYELEIADVSDAFRGSEFGITSSVLAAGGRVRGIVIPGGATWSRKQVDEIEAIAKRAGAGGLLRVKRSDGKFDGPIAKFLMPAAERTLPMPEGALALLVAAPDGVSSPALDRVRQECAQRLALVREDDRRFMIVTDFPMFEQGAVTGALGAVHHPFTAPNPDDAAAYPNEPQRWRSLAYDIVLNGMELGGGSIRVHDAQQQARILALLGISDPAEQERRFGFLLEGLRSGAPPHGGIAFGFDRIVMLLSGASSLRDVIAFPKTTTARALFEGAPTPLSEDDLRELHLRLEGS
jgi:aspartyl-tRNA synthetase